MWGTLMFSGTCTFTNDNTMGSRNIYRHSDIHNQLLEINARDDQNQMIHITSVHVALLQDIAHDFNLMVSLNNL